MPGLGQTSRQLREEHFQYYCYERDIIVDLALAEGANGLGVRGLHSGATGEEPRSGVHCLFQRPQGPESTGETNLFLLRAPGAGTGDECERQ